MITTLPQPPQPKVTETTRSHDDIMWATAAYSSTLWASITTYTTHTNQQQRERERCGYCGTLYEGRERQCHQCGGNRGADVL